VCNTIAKKPDRGIHRLLEEPSSSSPMKITNSFPYIQERMRVVLEDPLNIHKSL
jgi:hypothetical protein